LFYSAIEVDPSLGIPTQTALVLKRREN
jgi:hypothetical protein